MTAWPAPADFAGPPSAAQHQDWSAADRAARPARLGRLRERLATAGIDAYFGVRREHMRYLTGFTLADGEEKVAGNSGQFVVSGDEVVVLADSRYTIQVGREAPDTRLFEVYHDLQSRWSELIESVGARRVAVEAGFVSHAMWNRLAEAAPDVELVAAEGWVEADRAVKEPAELERVAAACDVADRALAALLPDINVGVTEAELALRLEWLIRTGGAEALAFDVACLAGAEAALPHGAPGDRPVLDGQVLLFDFGAQVAGYRSDMTRTLFVGEPAARDVEIYELVARAQSAAIEQLEAAVTGRRRDGDVGGLPSGRAIDAAAREVIAAAGHGEHFGHGTGHGIGLATHEVPSLGKLASDDPLPTPTVFSVEPGVYLAGEMGVRIEDLVLLDAGAGRVERLTRFPRDILVVGTDVGGRRPLP
ncbi:MAG TPA: Xaa-Pro peptidase family protein [Candidatus Limnocylindrales bacterium]|nr:Xaa-Pro peptidase family protein [Candidatus Limnocylindrales bacterium]